MEGVSTAKEKSAGAVIFRMVGGKRLYLILHYHFKGDYWDFPRGKIEGKETEMETAVREIREETQLTDMEFEKGFRQVTNWFYRWKGKNVYKEAVYFLAESKEGKVKISDEHVDFDWQDFNTTLQTLTFDNTKSILKSAHRFLESKKSKLS